MPHAVTHFEIHGRDQQSLVSFYKDLFGWHVDTNQPGSYGLVDTHAGEGINGGIVQSRQDQPMVTFYVEVDDLEGMLQRATGLGGRIVTSPTSMGTVTFALFSDPDGNVIGLAHDQTPRKAAKKTVKKAAKATARKATKSTARKGTARKATKAAARRGTARKSTARKGAAKRAATRRRR